MINISSEDSSYFYKRIISLLSELYYTNIYNLIKKCVSSEEQNEMEYFKSSLQSMVDVVKKNTESFYAKFKTGFEDPLLLDKCVSNLDYLHKKTFPKTYTSKDMIFQKISQEELFLSIIMYTTRELYRNRHLFDTNTKSSSEKIMQVKKSINIIKKSIKKSISDTFMNVFVNNLSRERMTDMKHINISNGTNISIPEYKLLKLIEESSTDGTIHREEKSFTQNELLYNKEKTSIDDSIYSNKEKSPIYKDGGFSDNPFIRRGIK